MIYRSGLIGAVGIGQIHANMYRRAADIELSAVADGDQELLDERATAWDFDEKHRCPEYERLLDSEDVDVLSVAAPSAFHYEPVVHAAGSQSGPGVIFCGKPLANSPEQADEMARRCESGGTELVVNHTHRFLEAFQSLRCVIHDGRVIGGSSTRPYLGQREVNVARYLLHRPAVLSFRRRFPLRSRGGYLVEDSDATEAFDDNNRAGTLVISDGTVAMLNEGRSSPVANSIQLVVRRECSEGRLRTHRLSTVPLLNGLLDDRKPRARGETASGATGEQWERDMRKNTTEFTSDAGMYGAQWIFDRVPTHLTALLDGEESNKSSGLAGAEVVETLSAIFFSSDTQSHVELLLPDRLRSIEICSQ